MEKNKALLVVDVQNDFCPGGALAVSQGDKIIPVLNNYIRAFLNKDLPVFVSRDWHPGKTTHFKDYGGLWPVHCVENTLGAAFHPDLKLPEGTILISKGLDPEKDSYSAFQGTDRNGKEFLDVLNSLEIKEIYIGGLATDYCVKSSCLDALKNGFKVYLLMDAIQGVNLKPNDSKKAIDLVRSQGVQPVKFADVPRLINKS